MIYNIIFGPHASLKETCRDVGPEEFGPELEQHISNMAQTMYAYEGIGLAGPQVGDMRRIIVADLGPNYKEDFVAMINPKVINRSDETISFKEGCLSFPTLEVEIERPQEVTVQYLTEKGEKRNVTLSEFQGVEIQHEIDHLNGKTLLDKVGRLKRRKYIKKIKKLKPRLRKIGKDFVPAGEP